MRELDVLLSHYLANRYRCDETDVQASFRALLELPDPDIFAYLVKREMPVDAGLAEIVRRIRRCRDS